MTRFLFALIAAFVLGPPTATAQAPSTAADVMKERQREAGRALAAELRLLQPVEAFEQTGTIRIRGGRREPFGPDVPFLFQVIPCDEGWRSVYTVGAGPHGGPEKLEIIHRPGLPNEYRFARAPRGEEFPDLERLSPREAEKPFAGSDFHLIDLGRDFLYWPGQQVLRFERRLGRPSDVLESRHSEDREVVRVVSWIEREEKAIMAAEVYDRNNRMVREFRIDGSALRRVNGVWHLEEMRMRSPIAGTETVLRFDLPR